ncbi:MAG: sigma factor-like helix-turn-helix DNA-binding protein [Planctomycetota bacterium]
MTDLNQLPAAPETEELLQRIRSGEADAWEAWYHRYHDVLLLSVRVHLGSKLRALVQSEDILQSVVVEALRELPRPDAPAVRSLRGLLHRMVLNKIRDRADHFATRKRAGTQPLTDTVAGRLAAPQPPPSYWNATAYVSGSSAASPSCRASSAKVVLLRRVQGLSSQEVAAAIGKTDAATRKLYSRALAQLTAMMQEEPPRERSQRD